MENLLTARECAAFLGITPNTLKIWRKKGIGPAYLKINDKNLRYDPREIDQWLIDLAKENK